METNKKAKVVIISIIFFIVSLLILNGIVISSSFIENGNNRISLDKKFTKKQSVDRIAEIDR